MAKKIINYLTALALAFCGALGTTSLAHAEDQEELPDTWVQVSPAAETVTLQGGDVLQGNSEKCPKDLDSGCAIEVKNIGAKSFRYRVYATGYSVKDEDYNLEFSSDGSNSYTQIVRWLTFKNSKGEFAKEASFEIAPGETQTVYYKIDVPEDVPGGAQHAVIWAETVGAGTTGGSGIQAQSRAGVVISGRSIGNTRQTADISEYGFTRFTFGGNLNAKATVKNTGNADFDVYYYYTARTLFGKELYSMSDSIATYPDIEYHIDVNWDNVPFLGIFQVQFRVSASDTVRDETHIVVIMPVFIMILLILLLTVIVVWIIIIIRKRKERKARTLV